jgi:hypothetical protein
MAKRLAEHAHREAPKIEAVVRQRERLPDGACAISIGLDRTSVRMAEPRPDASDTKPRRRRRKPRQRRPPPPVEVQWRMPYVGTVSFTDKDGEALATRRYACPASDEPAKLVARMMSDVRAARRRNPELNVGVVQDGAAEMWHLIREGLLRLKDDGFVKDWDEAIDRYHLLERLGDALAIVDADPESRKTKLRKWNAWLDAKDWAINDIERELTDQCIDLPKDEQQALLEHLIYIENNKDRMRYVRVAKKGLPVGSGVTESAAKTVVGRRAKNSGQRWSEAGLRGALTLRAVHQSGRLPRFWHFLSRRYTATIAEAA